MQKFWILLLCLLPLGLFAQSQSVEEWKAKMIPENMVDPALLGSKELPAEKSDAEIRQSISNLEMQRKTLAARLEDAQQSNAEQAMILKYKQAMITVERQIQEEKLKLDQ